MTTYLVYKTYGKATDEQGITNASPTYWYQKTKQNITYHPETADATAFPKMVAKAYKEDGNRVDTIDKPFIRGEKLVLPLDNKEMLLLFQEISRALNGG